MGEMRNGSFISQAYYCVPVLVLVLERIFEAEAGQEEISQNSVHVAVQRLWEGICPKVFILHNNKI
jgi:hypothetical protein